MMFSSCKMDNKTEIRNSINQPNKNVYSFYDFNFKIVIHRNPVGISKEIIYLYDSENVKNGKFKVTYFNYYDENNIKFKKPLEQSFYISKEKMNTVFDVIVKKITPKFSINYTEKKFPPPPTSSNEWEYCTVELDLLFRGNKYLVTTSNTDIFYDLLKLL